MLFLLFWYGGCGDASGAVDNRVCSVVVGGRAVAATVSGAEADAGAAGGYCCRLLFVAAVVAVVVAFTFCFKSNVLMTRADEI